MISNDLIKQKVLDFAFSGKMVDNVISDEYYLDISDSYEKFNGGNRVKYEDSIEEFKYELPSNWKWVRLEDVCDTFGRIGFRGYTKSDLVDTKNDGAISLSPSNIINGKLDYNSCTYITWDKYNESPEIKVKNGDIVLVKTASVGKNALVENLPHESTINPQFALLKNIRIVNKYLYYYLNTTIAKKHYDKFSIGTSVPTFSQGKINSILIPLCPLKEQKMIVEKLDEIYNLIEIKENNDNKMIKLKELLKEKVLDNAIHGKIIENDKELSPIDVVDIKNEIPFEIPSNWRWTTFDNISTIVRGGSPRPIKDYLTTSDDGINWIKIGDTSPNDIYINHVKEKIKPDGMKRSRFVEKGSLLLTNSMSFGRPYILNVDGCIHDGWLNIKDKNKNYYNLYMVYLLSSKYFYNVMSDKSSGAVVSNLNIDKVKTMLIPIPPLEEQKRIVEKIESLFELIEQL